MTNGPPDKYLSEARVLSSCSSGESKGAQKKFTQTHTHKPDAGSKLRASAARYFPELDHNSRRESNAGQVKIVTHRWDKDV